VTSIIIETQYLPPIAYFNQIQQAELIILEKYENFIKQSYRNRCYINTSQGKEMLIIPLTTKHGKTLITDVRIDYTQRWLNNQWRTFQTAYGNSPFFEFYEDEFHDVLFKKFEFLYDLNFNLLSLCLKWLKWNKEIKETIAYEAKPLMTKDLRNMINAKNYQESNKYDNPVTYNQVFGNMFVKNLSFIDLLFCTGPTANDFIR